MVSCQGCGTLVQQQHQNMYWLQLVSRDELYFGPEAQATHILNGAFVQE